MASGGAAALDGLCQTVDHVVKTIGEGVDVVVGYAAETEEHYACYADKEGGAAVAINLEAWQWLIVRDDIHRLDDEEIVVERDDGVD